MWLSSGLFWGGRLKKTDKIVYKTTTIKFSLEEYVMLAFVAGKDRRSYQDEVNALVEERFRYLGGSIDELIKAETAKKDSGKLIKKLSPAVKESLRRVQGAVRGESPELDEVTAPKSRRQSK